MKSKFLPHTKKNLEENYRIGMYGFYGPSEIDLVRDMQAYENALKKLNILASRLPVSYFKKPKEYSTGWTMLFAISIAVLSFILGTLQ